VQNSLVATDRRTDGRTDRQRDRQTAGLRTASDAELLCVLHDVPGSAALELPRSAL
jgi:hypothetical protein